MDESQRRIAENELVFRELNERIADGTWPGQSIATFRCECARLGCTALIEIPPELYERVRADARHFILISGHELPEAEVIVELVGDYAIVEKRDEAGRLAESRDPRH